MRYVLISSINTTVFFLEAALVVNYTGSMRWVSDITPRNPSIGTTEGNVFYFCNQRWAECVEKVCWVSLASWLEASRCWWPWRLSLWIYGGESKGARTPNFSCFFIWRCGVDGDEKLNAAAPPRRCTCPLPPVFFPFFKRLIFCTLLFNTHWIFLLRSLSVSATGVNACESFSDFELRSVLYAGVKYCSETCRFRTCPSVSLAGIYRGGI